MCVDFADLNRACLKDNFSLPLIDRFVNASAEHKVVSFMNAFSGYNQIMIDSND